MLRIHTGLRKLSKTNVYELHLKKNPLDIGKPCINITRSEVLFEQYIMDLKQDKYDTEIRDDDALKCNRFCFHATNVQFSGWIIYE